MPAWLTGAIATLDLLLAIALAVAWYRGHRELRELERLIELLGAASRARREGRL